MFAWRKRSGAVLEFHHVFLLFRPRSGHRGSSSSGDFAGSDGIIGGGGGRRSCGCGDDGRPTLAPGLDGWGTGLAPRPVFGWPSSSRTCRAVRRGAARHGLVAGLTATEAEGAAVDLRGATNSHMVPNVASEAPQWSGVKQLDLRRHPANQQSSAVDDSIPAQQTRQKVCSSLNEEQTSAASVRLHLCGYGRILAMSTSVDWSGAAPPWVPLRLASPLNLSGMSDSTSRAPGS
ncbi:hypothetical protein B5X24_HaOG212560 [Helicoverpa armigera]|uniref:Uncharacterized protein n=1 Tax=Helicoverpa armigera TaxID=29058 RepID=A0A2W1BG13_HELAM|nr:hypothetical protein B5X24_HaOG212560 [Helicoverpa armigera]